MGIILFILTVLIKYDYIALIMKYGYKNIRKTNIFLIYFFIVLTQVLIILFVAILSYF